MRLLTRLILLAILVGACTPDAGPVGVSPAPAEAPDSVVVVASAAPRDDILRDDETARPGTHDDPAVQVGAFLGAIDTEDIAAQRAAAGDAALALVAIRDVIRQENERRNAATTSVVTVTQDPETTAVDDDTAQVRVRADVVTTVTGPDEEVTSHDTIEGPVVLRRAGAGWRITDFSYSGEGLAQGWYQVDARQTSNDVTLMVGGILSYKSTTAAVVRLGTENGEQVPLIVRDAVLIDAQGERHERRQVAFESSFGPLGFVGFERVDGRPIALRVRVERPDTEERWVYDIRL